MKQPRVRNSDYNPSAAMLEKHAAKKKQAIDAMRRGYSAGAVARNMELSYHLTNYWRMEAGIKPLNGGKGRPTPEVGTVLV